MIHAAIAGDLAAFESLVRMYQVPVWRFLRHLLGDEHLAEDVTQETFIRLYRNISTFAFRAKFSTWTLQVARNAGIDALRTRERRDRAASLVPVAAPASEPGASFEIERALAALSDKMREALLLVEVFGFTYAEAAAVLDLPVGTVKSRVFKARTAMHEWYEAGAVRDVDEDDHLGAVATAAADEPGAER